MSISKPASKPISVIWKVLAAKQLRTSQLELHDLQQKRPFDDLQEENLSKEKICKKAMGRVFLKVSKEKMHKKATGRVFSEATKEKMHTRMPAKKEH
jgi:hypothetical protein